MRDINMMKLKYHFFLLFLFLVGMVVFAQQTSVSVSLVQNKKNLVFIPFTDETEFQKADTFGDISVSELVSYKQVGDVLKPGFTKSSIVKGGKGYLLVNPLVSDVSLTGVPRSSLSIVVQNAQPSLFVIGSLKGAEGTTLDDLEILDGDQPSQDFVTGKDTYYTHVNGKYIRQYNPDTKGFDALPIASDTTLSAGRGYIIKALKSFTIRLKAAPVVEPTISISSPAAGATVTTSSVDVQFTADHATGKKIKVLLDGVQVGDLLDPTATSATVSGLTDGSRTIKVEVVNDDTDGTSLPSPVFQEVTITVDLPVTFSGVAGSGCATQQDENKKQCTVSANDFTAGLQSWREEKQLQTCKKAATSTPKSIVLEWQTTVLSVGQACRINPDQDPATGKEACAQTAWPPTLHLTDAAGNPVVHFQRPAANACP